MVGESKSGRSCNHRLNELRLQSVTKDGFFVVAKSDFATSGHSAAGRQVTSVTSSSGLPQQHYINDN